jgi:ankyrin repeat protein
MHAAYNGNGGVVELLLEKMQGEVLDHREAARQEALRAPNSKRLADEANQDWYWEAAERLHTANFEGDTAIELAEREEHQIAFDMLELAEERLRQRKAYLDREALRGARAKCELGCGHTDRSDRIQQHMIHECRMRLVPCPDCMDLVMEMEVDEHLLKTCVKRIVGCLNSYLGCTIVLPYDERDMHSIHKCKKRLVECRLLCGVRMRWDERDHHEERKCRRRYVKCGLGCGEEIRAENRAGHARRDCELRMVQCRISCGARMKLKERDHHEGRCRAPCRWGCGSVIGPLDRRELHERFMCDKRTVTCPSGCELPNEGMPADKVKQHMARVCPRREVECPLGCPEKLRADVVHEHVQRETGDCPRRLVRCRWDYVGKRLKVYNALRQLWEPCLVIAWHPPGTPGALRAGPPPNGAEEDEGGAHDLRYGDGRTLTHRLGSLDFREAEATGWHCEWMAADDLDAHTAVCSLVPKLCGFGCGQLLSQAFLPTHQRERCHLRKVPCGLGCDYPFLREAGRWAHEENDCPKRLVRCMCGRRIPLDQLAKHQHAQEGDCDWSMLRCPHGCGLTCKRVDYEQHRDNECPKRRVECELGCGTTTLWADEAASHAANVCPYRSVLCRFGCGESMPAHETLEHEEKYCAKRVVECLCGVLLQCDSFRAHKVAECSEQLVTCPQGCGEQVRRADRTSHMEKVCKRRYITCPLLCCRQIFWDELEVHTTRWCKKRVMNCPECEWKMRYEDTPEHNLVCPQRMVPCGADNATCARSLTSWIRGGKMVQCMDHGETALTWACRHNDEKLARFLISSCDEPLLQQETKSGETALTRAAVMGYSSMCWQLIQFGAEIDYETQAGRTALQEASREGHMDVVKLCLEWQCKFDKQNHHKRTALHWARAANQKAVVQVLHSQTVVKRQLVELFVAIQLHDIATVDKLVKAGESHRLNHVKVLEEEAKQLDDSLMGLHREADSLFSVFRPMLPKVSKLRNELTRKEEAAAGLLVKADAVQAWADEKLAALDEKLRAVMLRIGRASSGEVGDLSELKFPPLQIMNIMKAVCLLRGVAPARVNAGGQLGSNDPRSRMLLSYWRPGLAMLKDPAFTNKLRYLNKSTIPTAAIVEVRKMLADEAHPFVYRAGDHGYTMAEALCDWVMAMESYERTHAELTPHKMRESAMRVDYNTRIQLMWQERKMVVMNEHRLWDIQEQAEEAEDEYDSSKNMILVLRDRARVANLLEKTSSDGHNALTWCCAAGNTDIASLLVRHGAPMEFCGFYVNLAASALQAVWRHHNWRVTRPKWNEGFAREYRLRQVGHLFALRSYVTKLREERITSRHALCEAFASGQHEIAAMLLRARDLDGKLCGPRPTRQSWVRPQPAAPRLCNPSELMKSSMNIALCATQGIGDLDCSFFEYGVGWKTANSRFDLSYDMAIALWDQAQRFIRKWQELKVARLRVRERTRIETRLNQQLEQAVSRWDFEEVYRLVNEGANIDHDTFQGHTALTMAAAAATMSMNVAGGGTDPDDRLLAVDLLLNREKSRPHVDRENKLGYSPLAIAAHNGRADVVSSLLKHGAGVHSCSHMNGKTALIHAASNGKWEIVKLLLERGANPSIRDHSGRTAIDWARELNYITVMKVGRSVGGWVGWWVGWLAGRRGELAGWLLGCWAGC